MNDSPSVPPTHNAASTPIRLISLIIFKWDSNHPIQLAASYDLSTAPFPYRSVVKQHILFRSRLIAGRTHLGGRQMVQFEENFGYCHVHVHTSGLCATAITSPSYPGRVAFSFLAQAIRTFQELHGEEWDHVTADIPEGQLFVDAGRELLKKYQNPTEADKILKVQKDLDEVKDVMLKNIDDLLLRGEKLEDLMQKSNDLTTSAQKLFRNAKRANQCCKWY